MGMQKMLGKYRGLSEYIAKIGIQGSDAEKQHGEEHITILSIGVIHEFGVPEHNIPERSFLRSTADINYEKYKTALRTAAQDVLIKPNVRPEQALFIVAQMVRKDVIDRIRTNQIRPDISDATKQRKGSDIVLFDDGFLLGSITGLVAKRGAEQAQLTGGSGNALTS